MSIDAYFDGKKVTERWVINTGKPKHFLVQLSTITNLNVRRPVGVKMAFTKS